VQRRRAAGWAAAVAGGLIVAGSVKAAESTELVKPTSLVTTGPYAVSRNPMYVGCGLLQLGIGLIAGSGWIISTLPLVGTAIHRDVVSEERRLEETFGDEYRQYCATTGRYFPKR
jgi:protein-S-isoprenylcysteine O-methyltransferase Ste14